MEQKSVNFNQLSTTELYHILQLRSEVFVVEQNCVYQDIDDLDCHPETLHNLFYMERNLAGYARILPPGLSYAEHTSIGRILTKENYRGSGLGHRLVEQSIRLAIAHWPTHAIKISAQLYLVEFYKGHGFKVVSEPYLEDGIEHISMELQHNL